MKRNWCFVGLIALAFCLVSSDSFAQRGPGMMWRGSGGWGRGRSIIACMTRRRSRRLAVKLPS